MINLSLALIAPLKPIEMGGGYFSPVLVLLSFAVAVLASFTTLSLVNRIYQLKGRLAQKWLFAGSISMGIGIWSMHFIGMLAFSMDMPFTYDVWMTIFSLLVGMISAYFAIYVASRQHVGWRKLIGAGFLLGPGIAAMHYTGMAAMQMEATISYDPLLFALSIIIAVVASIIALWISVSLSHHQTGFIRLKIGAALIMGIAICGMHYTGMAAAIYTPIPGYEPPVVVQQTDHMGLAIGVTATTVFILQLTVFAIYVERKSLVEKRQSKESSKPVETLDLKLICQRLSLLTRELTTPIQDVGYNTNFFKNCFEEIEDIISIYQQLIDRTKAGQLTPKILAEIEQKLEKADFEYLAEKIPVSIDQTIEGLDRVARIVRTMEEFSRPGEQHPATA